MRLSINDTTTPRLIASETLEFLIQSGCRIGIIDVREEGEFNASHIPSAVCVPRRVLEYRIGQMFPFKGEQLVICDDTGARALRAVHTLQGLGYKRTALLYGGV